jgi:glycosyltransferase involved in cell wall biosynthesis
MRQGPNGMRVLYLTWRDCDHPEAGGAEVFAERTAEELALLGHDVRMFSSSFAGATPVVERHGFSIMRRGGRYTVYLRAMAHLLRHRSRYDAVIDVQNGVPFWSPLFFRGTILNLTHHVHREQWFTFFVRPVAAFGWFLESKVAVRVYRRTRYVTVSEASRDDMVSIGIDRDRIGIVYSGIDPPADLDEQPRPARTPNPSFVTVGRLVSHKRVEIAIDSLHRFATQLPDLELHVVGDGYWIDRLREHASALGVSSRVHFHGFVDDHEKHRLLATSWVMSMPSLKEGWGLTIIEAGLHGTPAVAFRDAGGTQESIMDNQTGILADDVDSFHEALHRLATDTDYRLKLGENARRHASRFDWATSGRQLHDALVAAREQ